MSSRRERRRRACATYGRGEADLGAQSGTRNYVATPIAIPGPWPRVRVPGEPNSRPAVFVDAPHERLIVPTSAVGGGPAQRAVRRHRIDRARRRALSRSLSLRSTSVDSFRACATLHPRIPDSPVWNAREQAPATIDEIRHAKRINMHIDTSADLSADRSTSL